MRLRVLVADDHARWREGMVRAIAEAEGLEVAGECAAGAAAVEATRALRPDVVLLEVPLPGRGGLSACRQIVMDFAGVRVVLVSASPGDDFAAHATDAGAAGAVAKETPRADIVRLLRVVPDEGMRR